MQAELMKTGIHPLDQAKESRRYRQMTAARFLESQQIPYLNRQDGKRFDLTLNNWKVSYWPGANTWNITKPFRKSGKGLLPLMTILKRLNPEASSVHTDLQLIQDSWYLWLRLDFEDQTYESE